MKEAGSRNKIPARSITCGAAPGTLGSAAGSSIGLLYKVSEVRFVSFGGASLPFQTPFGLRFLVTRHGAGGFFCQSLGLSHCPYPFMLLLFLILSAFVFIRHILLHTGAYLVVELFSVEVGVGLQYIVYEHVDSQLRIALYLPIRKVFRFRHRASFGRRMQLRCRKLTPAARFIKGRTLDQVTQVIEVGSGLFSHLHAFLNLHMPVGYTSTPCSVRKLLK